jgi:acyl carrier protein
MTKAAQPVVQGEERPREKEIQDFIAQAISKVIHVPAGDIDLNISFDRYGLDSAAAVELTGDLEHWLHRKLPPTLLYDYPNIRAVSAYLAVGG